MMNELQKIDSMENLVNQISDIVSSSVVWR
jgi:hypothetical protein